jgi:hypothetical protein
MAKPFEEKYEDVLQNIEFGIVQIYRAHPEMTDAEALNAVEAAIRFYQAEANKRNPPPLRLSPLAQEAFNSAKAMCEWRMGRTHMLDEKNQPVDVEMTPRTVDEIVACLKRIRRSIEFWNKRGGRQGYLNYVIEFLP